MKTPYFPFYVKDWLCSRSTLAMSGEAVKAYIYLLAESWLQEPRATLPNDDTELLSMARTTNLQVINEVKKRFKIGECELHKGLLYSPLLLELSCKLHNKQRFNNENAKRTQSKRKKSQSKRKVFTRLANANAIVSESLSESRIPSNLDIDKPSIKAKKDFYLHYVQFAFHVYQTKYNKVCHIKEKDAISAIKEMFTLVGIDKETAYYYIISYISSKDDFIATKVHHGLKYITRFSNKVSWTQEQVERWKPQIEEWKGQNETQTYKAEIGTRQDVGSQLPTELIINTK